MVRYDKKQGITKMKPIYQPSATEHAPTTGPRGNFPVPAQRIAIDFRPHVAWTLEVGRARPANPAPRHPVAYKPACGLFGLAPLELVVAVANQKTNHRPLEGRQLLWTRAVIA